MYRPAHITGIFGALILMLCIQASHAGSATWKRNPRSSDWNTKTNWTPATVPNGSADIATFGLSHNTDVSISADIEVDSITFTSAATNPYTITVGPGLTLTIRGVGITNDSGTMQNFVTAVDGAGNFGQILFTNSAAAGTSIFTNNGSATGNFSHGSGETAFFDTSTADSGTFVNKGATGSGTNSAGGRTVFHNSSTAGNANFINSAGTGTGTSATLFFNNSTAGNGFFTNNGGGSVTGGEFKEGGQTIFSNTSTAANGTFVNNGATASGGFGGATVFDDSSTAGNGMFINNGGAASGVAALGGGATFFFGTSTAANGTFTNNAAPASGAEGGVTEFGLDFLNFSPSAGSGTFINNGATVSGAVGGKTVLKDASTADAATLIANGGTNGGGGGAIFFEGKSTGGTPRIEVFGNGFLDISGHLGHAGLTIGSIEGDGNAFLGSNNLTVGSNGVSTVFSGVLQDGGESGGTGSSLTKIGSGTLTLSGINTYTGATIIKGGVLQVDGSITSNTFVGPSGSNHSATLTGTGTIHGSVTNNGTVSPGDGPGTLTVNSYTQMSGSTLLIDIAGPNAGQFSVLDVLGTANLNGCLDPVLQNGFVPTVGESFTFMDYESVLGAFASIQNLNFNNNTEHWAITYQPTFGVLTAEAGRANVPDQGSTFLLLTLSLLGLATYRQKWWPCVTAGP
jgi:autotransporter-associated beta strand protein